MAAPKRATHVVVHPRLYLNVDKKLQHVPAGTSMTFTPVQAKKLGKRVKAISNEVVELTEPSKVEDKVE